MLYLDLYWIPILSLMNDPCRSAIAIFLSSLVASTHCEVISEFLFTLLYSNIIASYNNISYTSMKLHSLPSLCYILAAVQYIVVILVDMHHSLKYTNCGSSDWQKAGKYDPNICSSIYSSPVMQQSTFILSLCFLSLCPPPIYFSFCMYMSYLYYLYLPHVHARYGSNVTMDVCFLPVHT